MDRESLRNWRWIGRFWMTLFTIANVTALVVAAVAIAITVVDGRCSALEATAAETFSFATDSLRNLRIESTRGTVNTVTVPAGSAMQVLVTVSADSPETLAKIRMSSVMGVNGTAGVAVGETVILLTPLLHPY